MVWWASSAEIQLRIQCPLLTLLILHFASHRNYRELAGGQGLTVKPVWWRCSVTRKTRDALALWRF